MSFLFNLLGLVGFWILTDTDSTSVFASKISPAMVLLFSLWLLFRFARLMNSGRPKARSRKSSHTAASGYFSGSSSDAGSGSGSCDGGGGGDC